MVTQSQNSSPTFSSSQLEVGGGVGIPPQQSASHFTPIRSSDPPSTQPDGYDVKQSPISAGTPGGEPGTKRRKVNHGMAKITPHSFSRTPLFR